MRRGSIQNAGSGREHRQAPYIASPAQTSCNSRSLISRPLITASNQTRSPQIGQGRVRGLRLEAADRLSARPPLGAENETGRAARLTELDRVNQDATRKGEKSED